MRLLRVFGRLLGILVAVAMLAALAISLLRPDESLQFISTTEPLNGWPGSMFAGFAFAGFLAVIGMLAMFIRWLTR